MGIKKKDANAVLKDNAKKNELKATTQESIPFVACYDNGTIQTKTGCFTRMYKIGRASCRERV